MSLWVASDDGSITISSIEFVGAVPFEQIALECSVLFGKTPKETYHKIMKCAKIRGVCECGSEKSGSSVHSDWCQKFIEGEY